MFVLNPEIEQDRARQWALSDRLFLVMVLAILLLISADRSAR